MTYNLTYDIIYMWQPHKEKEIYIMEKVVKLTKKDKFNMLKEIVVDLGNDMLVEFIDNELSLLEKKSSKSTQTKTQVENEKIKDLIVDVLVELGKPVSITELQKSNDNLGVLSNQKISSLLTQLKEENRVVRVEEKKKAYFTVASV